MRRKRDVWTVCDSGKDGQKLEKSVAKWQRKIGQHFSKYIYILTISRVIDMHEMFGEPVHSADFTNLLRLEIKKKKSRPNRSPSRVHFRINLATEEFMYTCFGIRYPTHRRIHVHTFQN